jgi:hypothetical protein
MLPRPKSVQSSQCSHHGLTAAGAAGAARSQISVKGKIKDHLAGTFLIPQFLADCPTRMIQW